MYGVLIGILLLTCCVLVTSVLLQAGQGGGLASLGGGAGTEVLMGGRQAVTILTHVTRWSAGIFLLLAFVLAILSARGGRPTSVLEGNIPAPQPVQTTPLPLQSAPPAGQQQAPAQPQSQTPNR